VPSGAGVRVFAELGPDATVSASGPDQAAGADQASSADQAAGDGAVFLQLMPSGEPEVESLIRCVAQAYVRGVAVGWGPAVAPRAEVSRRADLPTYAFQRRRYWPPVSTAGMGTAALVGLARSEYSWNDNGTDVGNGNRPGSSRSCGPWQAPGAIRNWSRPVTYPNRADRRPPLSHHQRRKSANPAGNEHPPAGQSRSIDLSCCRLSGSRRGRECVRNRQELWTACPV